MKNSNSTATVPATYLRKSFAYEARDAAKNAVQDVLILRWQLQSDVIAAFAFEGIYWIAFELQCGLKEGIHQKTTIDEKEYGGR